MTLVFVRHKSSLPKVCITHDKNVFFTLDQKISKNYLARLSFPGEGLPFPGDLSLGIIFKASNSFFSVIHFSHSRDCSLENRGNLKIKFS